MDQASKGGHEFGAQASIDAWHDTLTQDSAGQVRPRYWFVPQQAGRLARGELAVEPVLGPVRVAAVRPDLSSFVHLSWSDDYGPCEAAGRYPAGLLLPVRVPAQADRLLVRQGIDRATWHGQDISSATARLIAAHLHLGPRSALYRFAVNGAVPDQLYDELNQVDTSRPAFRPWVAALARYCLSREDDAPVQGWGRNPPANAEQPDAERPFSRRPTKAATQALTGKRMSTETTVQLIDAAYALGVVAGQVSRPRRQSVAEGVVARRTATPSRLPSARLFW